MSRICSKPFIKVGSFKGKNAKADAQQAAKEINDHSSDQVWEAVSLGAKKQKGNAFALQRVS